jgi:membrane-associated phospholipid phosphatase
VIPIDLPYRGLREMSSLTFWLAHCRTAERVVLTFFVYTAVLSLAYGLSPLKCAIAILTPMMVFALACAESCWGSTRWSIAREWLLPGTVIGGYWQMGWFSSGHNAHWETTWLGWDRVILETWGLRQLAEHSLTFIPGLLELSYLLLYAIPPVCLGILYWRRARLQVDRFLVVFAMGTLTVYALLPLVAVQSPRLAFPGQDLPAAQGIWRGINVWILDHLDISTSVFPSGHVAVAFSCAFGMKRALPDSRLVFGFLLFAALLVFSATIYGRYHYAVDGFASIVICAVCWGLCHVYDRVA